MNLFHLQNGSDIRGTAAPYNPAMPVNFTDEDANAIASAFAEWLKQKTGKHNPRIAIGRDSRTTGKALSRAASIGMACQGALVIDTGLSTTPAMFMATQFEDFDADGAIMLTASHLPSNRNGMKFFTKEGGLEKEDISEILTLAGQGNLPAGSGGIVVNKDLMSEYAQHLQNIIRKKAGTSRALPLEGMHIVVDAGNGAGGFFATEVLKPLGADIRGSQFLYPDGTFPNHIPNPENAEAMKSLADAVKEYKADLGLIFDTDVDRASAVDSKGNPISRNDIIALASLIAAVPGSEAIIVTDSVTSNQLKDFLESKGLEQHRYKRGYRNVINEAIRLNEEGKNCPLAIETSGHAAFRENYFLDDGAYLGACIAGLSTRWPIEKMLEDLKHPAESIELRMIIIPENYKEYGQEIIKNIQQAVLETEGMKLEEPNYEGVRINFDSVHGNGWALLRTSLHENKLVINIESDSAGGCLQIQKALMKMLEPYDLESDRD